MTEPDKDSSRRSSNNRNRGDKPTPEEVIADCKHQVTLNVSDALRRVLTPELNDESESVREAYEVNVNKRVEDLVDDFFGGVSGFDERIVVDPDEIEHAKKLTEAVQGALTGLFKELNLRQPSGNYSARRLSEFVEGIEGIINDSYSDIDDTAIELVKLALRYKKVDELLGNELDLSNFMSVAASAAFHSQRKSVIMAAVFVREDFVEASPHEEPGTLLSYDSYQWHRYSKMNDLICEQVLDLTEASIESGKIKIREPRRVSCSELFETNLMPIYLLDKDFYIYPIVNENITYGTFVLTVEHGKSGNFSDSGRSKMVHVADATGLGLARLARIFRISPEVDRDTDYLE